MSTHNTSAGIVPWDKAKGTWAVLFKFDDGQEEYAFSGTKKQAEWDAYDRVGEEFPLGVNPLLRPIEKMEALKEQRRREQKS
jgi:hypothetical protein